MFKKLKSSASKDAADQLKLTQIGIQNYTVTLGKDLAISYKGKHIPHTWPETSLLGTYPKE